jgi:hypothetical protein
MNGTSFCRVSFAVTYESIVTIHCRFIPGGNRAQLSPNFHERFFKPKTNSFYHPHMKKQFLFAAFLFAFIALPAIQPVAASAQSSINWTTAIHYAKLVKIAEGVDPTADYSAADKQSISALGYTYLQTVYGSDLSTDVDPDAGDTVSYGFLARSSSGELVAILRGTDTVLEWIDDAQFYFVSNPISHSDGFTEEGFTAIYKSLRTGKSSSSQTLIKAIKSYLTAGTATSVTVSGHSLGGALANLLTLDIAHNSTLKTPVVYSFASPRVGEYFFKSDYNDTVSSSYRVFNSKDLVPDIPEWPYEQVKDGFKLVANSSQVTSTIACEHHLTTYLWLMGQAAGVDAGSLDSDCVAGN